MKEKNKVKWLLVLAYGLGYLICYLTNIHCIWRWLFHIPCPGCGFTSSIIKMLQFDFAGAWKCHPMFWSSGILILYFIFDGRVFKNKVINKIVIWAVIAMFFIVWVIRLVRYAGML